ncbi:MAG: NAD(P)-dependent oxidoreductase [Desulfomonilaceae bacterium]|jgi:dTDP-6-deoxy-L-talose 4-dehydrogenase (NAD+)
MTLRVLVTGATGFVGRQIVRSLAAQGADIVAVVREGKVSQVEALPRITGVTSTPDAFAESPDWWARVCKGVDTVIHAAWYVEPGKYLQSPKNLDCLSGTLNIARGVVQAGVRRFVGVGTCVEYDLELGVLSVVTPLKPLTPYAAAKAAAYMALSQWLPGQSVEFVWCRLFYLYGEGEDERRLVPYVRAKLAAGEVAELTSGKQIRDFLDVVEAGRLIAKSAIGTQQGPVNICSGVSITVRQLAEQIADEYGRRDLLKFGARPDNSLDPPCVFGIRNL